MKNFTQAIFAILLVSTCFISKAQEVGIGTTSPMSTLDIKATNQANPSNKDGLLIPRIDAFPSIDPGPNQDGMLVFLTTPTGTYKKGFHYWDDVPKQWISYIDEWTDGNVSQTHAGFTDDLIYAQQANASGADVVVLDSGHIGMGTSAPEESLELRLEGDNDIQISSASPSDAPQLVFYTTNGTFASPTFLNDDDEIGYMTGKVWRGSGKSGDVANIQMKADGNHTSTSLPTKIEFEVTATGDTGLGYQPEMVIRNNGNVGIGLDDPTAKLELKAGTATANTAPLKLTAGTNLATPERGAIEFDGTNLYFTPVATRQIMLTGVTATLLLDFPNIPSRSTSEQTRGVTGATVGSSCSCAPVGSIENNLQWSCYVSAAGTVKIRVSNISTGAINPVSKNWKITILD